MANKGFVSGIFRKVAHNDGGGFVFKVGAKRDYKNKETGKYEYDNVTVIIPKFQDATIKYVDQYVHDGDIVECEYHVNSYAYEKDGQKMFREDHTCDNIRLVVKKGEPNEKGNGTEKAADPAKTALDEGTVVDDTDCPW